MTSLPIRATWSATAAAPPAWKLPNGAKLAVSMVDQLRGRRRACRPATAIRYRRRCREIVSVVPPGTMGPGHRADLRLRHARRHLAHARLRWRRHKRQIDLLHVRPGGRARRRRSPASHRRGRATRPPATAGCGGRTPDYESEAARSGATSSAASTPCGRDGRAAGGLLQPRQREPVDARAPARPRISPMPATASTTTCPIGTGSDACAGRCWSCPTRSTATT